jgi:TPP-dependent pyruvate/acetoin dehydrogenase alpha subunit
VTNQSGLALLRSMLRIRTVEETIADRYRDGKMRCPTHLCTGQEAVSAAVGLALRHDDFAVSTHRAHGHYLGKGGDLRRMLAEIYGKRTGCSAGKGGSMHLVDRSVGFMGSTAIVGNTVPIGVGLGLSIQLHGTDQVSCVFLGDAVAEEGVFFESVNFAVLRGLPVLFVCENNRYSVYSSLNVRQPAGRSIRQMVAGLGIETHEADGNDAQAVHVLTTEAVATIRREQRPVFMEFFTYRWREHCGPNFDNDIGYRTEAEYQEWKRLDPIPRLVAALEAQHALSKSALAAIEAGVRSEVEDAFAFADTSPFPEADELFDDIYESSERPQVEIG